MGNLLLTGIGLLAIYLLSCWVWPYTTCGVCKGSPRHMSPLGTAWRNCGSCGGSGRKVRLGRKLLPNPPD